MWRCVSMHVCLHACLSVCLSVCRYVCMSVYMYSRANWGICIQTLMYIIGVYADMLWVSYIVDKWEVCRNTESGTFWDDLGLMLELTINWMVHWTFSLVLWDLETTLAMSRPIMENNTAFITNQEFVNKASHVTPLLCPSGLIIKEWGRITWGRLLHFLHAQSCLKLDQFWKHVPVIASSALLSICEVILASK